MLTILCLLLFLAATPFVVIFIIGWLTEASQHQARRPRRYSSEEYQSPLGMVDDPDDEWIEWAIMDDLLNLNHYHRHHG